jgi:Ca-activated chloride channel family protein
MHFVAPDAALWLLVLPVVWAAWLLHRWLRDRARRLSGFGPGIERVSRIAGPWHDVAVATLATIAVVGLVVAAMRPQAAVWTPEYESRDLLLLLDRSASMQAEDVQPSRARRASLEIRNFIEARPDAVARVGLIGFAGSSITLSQKTRDASVVLFYLDWLEDDRRPLFGTNLNAALENALEVVKQGDARHPTVVVVVSDGEDYGDRLQDTVARFSAQRIPIYTIGIGSSEEVTIPAPDQPPGGVLLDERGAPLKTRLDERPLQAIAAESGGRYFRSMSGGELRAALDQIATSGRRLVGRRIDQYRELYPWSLACGALALAALLIVL